VKARGSLNANVKGCGKAGQGLARLGPAWRGAARQGKVFVRFTHQEI